MAPDDPTPENIDEPETELLPDDPSERLGPDIPRVPDTAANDADPELKKQFWTVVLLFNVALFGMSLGLMLIGFERRWKFGGALFAVGVVAFVRGWSGYREATSDSAETTDDAEAETGDSPAASDDFGVRKD